MYIWWLLLFLFFNKTILILLSKIFKKDIKVIKPEFWLLIRWFILFLLIYHFKDILYILNEFNYIIKELLKEFQNFKEGETIIIKPNEPLQGSEHLNSAYRLYYYRIFSIMYYIFRECILLFKEERQRKSKIKK